MTEILVSQYHLRNGQHLKFYFNTDHNMFVHTLKDDNKDNGSYSTLNYNRLNAFFSRAAQDATMDMKRKNLNYDEIHIKVSSKEEDNNSYSDVYEIIILQKPKQNNVEFILTDDNKVVIKLKSAENKNLYVSRDVDNYPEEVKEKINFLKNYFNSKGFDMEYIDMMFKGNFMELGDPVV